MLLRHNPLCSAGNYVYCIEGNEVHIPSNIGMYVSTADSSLQFAVYVVINTQRNYGKLCKNVTRK